MNAQESAHQVLHLLAVLDNQHLRAENESLREELKASRKALRELEEKHENLTAAVIAEVAN